jgi:hypothetical protein
MDNDSGVTMVPLIPVGRLGPCLFLSIATSVDPNTAQFKQGNILQDDRIPIWYNRSVKETDRQKNQPNEPSRKVLWKQNAR